MTKTRRIFRSSHTSLEVIRELLQSISLAELLSPSKEFWLVSPWISDFVLFDNRSGRFGSINPQWLNREIRFVDYSLQLMTNETQLVIVTRPDPHNQVFLNRLVDRASENSLDKNLKIFTRKKLHTKGILTDAGLLLGSMNLTYSGLELNEEFVTYEIASEAIAKARIEFLSYYSESLND